MPAGRVQEALRELFARWGRPDAVRVDNGSPWGTWSDLPPPLALWLVGLRVGVTHNPPGRPQHNGVVERGHGVAQAWAEPGRCRSAAELQARVDDADRVQRDEYPHAGLPSRSAAYPALAYSGRRYSRRWEAAAWSWAAAVRYLGGSAVRRRVDSSGKVGLDGGKVGVGAVNRGKSVTVQLDADAVQWVVWDDGGVELCRRPLTQLDPASLRALPSDETWCPDFATKLDVR